MNDSPPREKKPNILRRLYAWTLRWSEHRFGVAALAGISFAESSFFPIPPDVLLMPLCFARPKRWWVVALVCSVASVLGAVLGWLIGALFWQAIGPFFFDHVPGFTEEKFEMVRGYYDRDAFLWLVASAFTPIPFKIFTVASGVFGVSLKTLIIASLIGRSARFFLVAGMIRLFGPAVRPFLEKYLEWAALVLFLLALAGFMAIKWLH